MGILECIFLSRVSNLKEKMYLFFGPTSEQREDISQGKTK